MNRLLFITGSPCVGKTTCGEKLMKVIDNSAFLDGDAVWRTNPSMRRDKLKIRILGILDNIRYVVDNYFKVGVQNVIVSSVLTDRSDIEYITNKMEMRDYSLFVIALVCDKKTLTERTKLRSGIHARPANVNDLIRNCGFTEIDNSAQSPDKTVAVLKTLIFENGETSQV